MTKSLSQSKMSNEQVAAHIHGLISSLYPQRGWQVYVLGRTDMPSKKTTMKDFFSFFQADDHFPTATLPTRQVIISDFQFDRSASRNQPVLDTQRLIKLQSKVQELSQQRYESRVILHNQHVASKELLVQLEDMKQDYCLSAAFVFKQGNLDFATFGDAIQGVNIVRNVPMH